MLDIRGHCDARNNARPELDRWRRDKLRREGNRVEIIREVRYGPTVPRATEHARMTLSIVTDATEVLPARVGQEDIGARIQPGLCSALEPSSDLGEARHLEVRRHGHEKVDIFRPRLGRDHGADQRDASDAWTRARRPDEVGRELEERRPDFAR